MEIVSRMKLLHIQTLFRSVFLGMLYVALTKDDDTTIVNVSRFSLLYLVLFMSATFVGIDQNVITTAFTTKFIFTFLDDHIQLNKRLKQNEKQTQTS